MGTVPEHELAAVRNMTGYDQMLEIDRLCKTYGLDETTLRAMMASASGGAGVTAPQPSAQTWDTSHKDVRVLSRHNHLQHPRWLTNNNFDLNTTRAGKLRHDENRSVRLFCVQRAVWPWVFPTFAPSR